MANKILIVFIVFDIIFLLCAGLHLFIPLYTRMNIKNNTNVDNIASNLLLDHCPLTASMVNSVMMFITFLLSLPAFFMHRNRAYLKLHATGVVICSLLTFAIGIDIWFSTLQTRKNLAPIWNSQTPAIQTMLQAKFQCCGYSNPALFVKDDTCVSAATAARLGPCITPFGVFANSFLDVVFTTFFGFVAVDMMLLLAALCLVKDRKEKERYRLIDEKRGFGPI
ncbi:putative tetraspanin [Cladophialophora carrionii]|uniref:Putative tetraspanin n=1 Tax=Cladophialophora carrionii TaxID=86049 RepID=A0A1C1CQ11_9EURO|nr:putative tetraspanin [Cladophialophora carrionii]